MNPTTRPRRAARASAAALLLGLGLALVPHPAMAEEPFAQLQRQPLVLSPTPTADVAASAVGEDIDGATGPSSAAAETPSADSSTTSTTAEADQATTTTGPPTSEPSAGDGADETAPEPGTASSTTSTTSTTTGNADDAPTSTSAPSSSGADEAATTTTAPPTTSTTTVAAEGTPAGGDAASGATTVVAAGDGEELSPPERDALAAAPGRVRATVTDVEPFQLIGVSQGAPATGHSLVRVHTAEGWGPWEDATFDADHGPDAGTDEADDATATIEGTVVSEPVWVGEADGYEVNLPEGATAASALLVREQTHLVPQDGTEAAGAVALPRVGVPNITPRSAWYARAPKATPDVAPRVQVGIVHHSVQTNDYGPYDVPALLRSVQTYHMDANGWNDIAYNFAVDRFGGIWEARAGGIDNAVIGGHARGFNTGTTGVVALGNFSTGSPPAAMVQSIGVLLGWKLYQNGRTPDGTGFVGGRFLPNVVGHRDVNQTECPGNLLYAQLPTIRSIASSHQANIAAGAAFWDNLAIGTNADGRLEVFAVGLNHQVWHNWQTPQGTWSGWRSMGLSVAGKPVVANNADGRMELLAIGTDGALWHGWQIAVNGDWAWGSQGGSWSVPAGVALATNADGRLEAFVLGDDDRAWSTWQVAPNAPWSSFAPIGGSFPSYAGLTAANDADGRIEVFAVGDGNVLVHAWQRPGGGWSSFQQLGGSVTGDPAAARNADGRLEVVGVSATGVMWQAWQTAPNGDWSTPKVLATGFNPAAPADIAANADGRLQAFALDSGGSLRSAWQRSPNGDWSAARSLGGSGVGGVQVASMPDGRLRAFAPRSPVASGVAFTEQIAPNASWVGWSVVP